MLLQSHVLLGHADIHEEIDERQETQNNVKMTCIWSYCFPIFGQRSISSPGWTLSYSTSFIKINVGTADPLTIKFVMIPTSANFNLQT